MRIWRIIHVINFVIPGSKFPGHSFPFSLPIQWPISRFYVARFCDYRVAHTDTKTIPPTPGGYSQGWDACTIRDRFVAKTVGRIRVDSSLSILPFLIIFVGTMPMINVDHRFSHPYDFFCATAQSPFAGRPHEPQRDCAHPGP